MRAEAEQIGLSSARTSSADGQTPRMQGQGTGERPGPAPRDGVGRLGPQPESGDGALGQTPPPNGADGGDGSERPDQRLPGLDPMFQAPDESWRPLTLGPEGDWPHPELWPPDGAGSGSADESDFGDEPRRPGEAHEPLPPPQENAEGSL
jgi:hypothetical protein